MNLLQAHFKRTIKPQWGSESFLQSKPGLNERHETVDLQKKIVCCYVLIVVWSRRAENSLHDIACIAYVACYCLVLWLV